MKFVSFYNPQRRQRLGLLAKDEVLDLQKIGLELHVDLPHNINDFLKGGEEFMMIASEIESRFINNQLNDFKNAIYNLDSVKLTAPIPNPPSCRDAYAFRRHVASARLNRGLQMIPEFDQFPIFYFTNHNGITGQGDISVELDHLQKLDFELELAAVIGKKGKNISSNDADSYIAGFTIMNDFSARTLQMEEMTLSLGPAKGKDFATAIGPWLVTPDELEDYKINTQFGNIYNLQMSARHNGKLVSTGNAKDMNWTFAEIIERASYGVEIYPGDVIGSGTVGTGCYLELNGTWAREAKERNESFSPVWLNAGDEIELEITGLGNLTNKIVLSDNNFSILSKKKNI